jgi:hypothetical protein
MCTCTPLRCGRKLDEDCMVTNHEISRVHLDSRVSLIRARPLAIGRDTYYDADIDKLVKLEVNRVTIYIGELLCV